MKNLFFLFFLFQTLAFFSQNLVVSKDEHSRTFKGKIGDSKITLFIESKGIIDCNDLDVFLEGWMVYDKIGKKIPLGGYVIGCELKLYNYGEKHTSILKNLKQKSNNENINSLYSKAPFEFVIAFDKCNSDSKKITEWKGILTFKTKVTAILLETNNFYVDRHYEIYKLPNNKSIDLMEIMLGYGGNAFYVMKEDKTENRVIFSFESISNHNACGMCGASEGEKGYRIIYFDKQWKVIKTKEYLIESCLSNIYDTKTLKETNALIEYKVGNDEMSEDGKSYILVIDKENATITKRNN